MAAGEDVTKLGGDVLAAKPDIAQGAGRGGKLAVVAHDHGLGQHVTGDLGLAGLVGPQGGDVHPGAELGEGQEGPGRPGGDQQDLGARGDGIQGGNRSRGMAEVGVYPLRERRGTGRGDGAEPGQAAKLELALGAGADDTDAGGGGWVRWSARAGSTPR